MDISVRQAAFATILSWGPTASFWLRIVLESHEEKNVQMKKLINKVVTENLHHTYDEFLPQLVNLLNPIFNHYFQLY